jgi:hypothetical protein
MHAFADFWTGLRASLTRPALAAAAWLYAAATAATALFAAAAFGAITAAVGPSAMALRLREGVPTDWLIDILGRPPAAASLFGLVALGALLTAAYLVAVVLVTGGVVSAAARATEVPGAPPPRPFLAASFSFAGMAARLALLELLALALAAVVAVGLLVAGAFIGLGNAFRWAWVAVTLVALVAVAGVFDLARIRALVLGERKATRAVTASAALVGRRAAPFLLLMVFATTLTVLATGAALWLHSRAGSASAAGVALAFVVGQLSVGVRIWSRVAAYCAEAAFFSRTQGPER